jgi:methylated-DNA-protein-cysteine methyltransferase-like protein
VELLRASLPGELLTYGELARLAGRPGAARAAGRVLAESSDLPWWRVVTSTGRLVPGHEHRQAQLLADEGVECMAGHVLRFRSVRREAPGCPRNHSRTPRFPAPPTGPTCG